MLDESENKPPVSSISNFTKHSTCHLVGGEPVRHTEVTLSWVEHEPDPAMTRLCQSAGKFPACFGGPGPQPPFPISYVNQKNIILLSNADLVRLTSLKAAPTDLKGTAWTSEATFKTSGGPHEVTYTPNASLHCFIDWLRQIWKWYGMGLSAISAKHPDCNASRIGAECLIGDDRSADWDVLSPSSRPRNLRNYPVKTFESSPSNRWEESTLPLNSWPCRIEKISSTVSSPSAGPVQHLPGHQPEKCMRQAASGKDFFTCGAGTFLHWDHLEPGATALTKYT